uniref:Uncharacterized protein n=1 Tax=Janibacter limosus TaxID=53458 RepID=A0AC61U1U5_9MICO|nr:TIGR03089 family protein [Janibacter limosus]
MSTPAEVLATLQRTDSAAPRITCHDDLPGPTAGERVELSARVPGNWVSKAANALQEEWDIEPGSVVHLAMRPHWRLAYWAWAIWSVGAVLDLDGEGSPDPVVTDDPARLPRDGPAVLVTRAALARSAGVPLPRRGHGRGGRPVHPRRPLRGHGRSRRVMTSPCAWPGRRRAMRTSAPRAPPRRRGRGSSSSTRRSRPSCARPSPCGRRRARWSSTRVRPTSRHSPAGQTPRASPPDRRAVAVTPSAAVARQLLERISRSRACHVTLPT